MLLTPIVIVACTFKAVSGAKRKPKPQEIKTEITGNETLEDIMNMVDKHELRLETVKSIHDKFGEKLLTSLTKYQTPEYYERSLRSTTERSIENFKSDSILKPDSNFKSDPKSKPKKTRRDESLPDMESKSPANYYAYLMDSADQDTKDNVIRLMKHIVYAAQDEIALFTPIVQKYSKYLRFRLAYTFRMLEEIGYEFRMLYLRMKNQNSPYGKLSISSYVLYYTQAFKKYTDIIYISEQIARLYHNYKYEKEMAMEEYQYWLDMNPMWKNQLTPPPSNYKKENKNKG